MEVLLELLIIEIIFLQSKFTQSAQPLDVFFKSVQWPGAGWYGADSAFLLPELSRHDSSFCIPAPVLSGQESRQLFLFKTKLIIFCVFYSLKICKNTGISRKMPGKGRPQSLWWSHFQMFGGQVLHCLVK